MSSLWQGLGLLGVRSLVSLKSLQQPDDARTNDFGRLKYMEIVAAFGLRNVGETDLVQNLLGDVQRHLCA